MIGCVAVLLIGCSSSDDDGAFDGNAPDESSSTSTTATTIAACPTVEVADPSGAEGTTQQEADVDGDGQADLVQSFPEGDHVTLLVDLAAGGGATTELAADDTVGVAVLGGEALDAARDGRELLWVRVGSGASTTILGLFHLEDCRLEAATFEDGSPVQLPIGGTVGTVSGARCGSHVDAEADLVVYDASSLDGTDYDVVTTEYRWEDGVLVRSPDGAPTVSQTGDLSEIVGFRCGDLEL